MTPAQSDPQQRKGLAKGLAQGSATGLAEGPAKGLAKVLAKGIAKGLATGLAKRLAGGLTKVPKPFASADLAQGACVQAWTRREALARKRLAPSPRLHASTLRQVCACKGLGADLGPNLAANPWRSD